jgi:hypothetical protein
LAGGVDFDEVGSLEPQIAIQLTLSPVKSRLC